MLDVGKVEFGTVIARALQERDVWVAVIHNFPLYSFRTGQLA